MFPLLVEEQIRSEAWYEEVIDSKGYTYVLSDLKEILQLGSIFF